MLFFFTCLYAMLEKMTALSTTETSDQRKLMMFREKDILACRQRIILIQPFSLS